MADFKLALVCDPGCEEYAVLEVKEILGKKAVLKKGFVLFDASPEEAQKICFYSQTANRILVSVINGSYVEETDFENFEKQILSFDYSGFHTDEMSFKVISEVEDCDNQTIAALIGEMLHENNSWKVDLNIPDMKLVVKGFDGSFVIGIDLTGRPLEKREYKIYHSRKTIRGTIAYSLVRFAGFTGKEKLLDPFCLDGSIIIEAAIFASKFSINHYNQDFDLFKMPLFKGLKDLTENVLVDDYAITGYSSQLKEVNNARANSKIAGVVKNVRISKVDVSWLDTKFDEKSVDLIVTYIPESGKSISLNKAVKIQEEFFWQADYVLSDKGFIAIIGDKVGEISASGMNKGFELVEKKLVYMGKKDLWFMKFSKSKKSVSTVSKTSNASNTSKNSKVSKTSKASKVSKVSNASKTSKVSKVKVKD